MVYLYPDLLNHTAKHLVRAAFVGAALGVAPGVAEVPPARDGAVAIQAELGAALADGSNAALILFIARFPDQPLADQARQALLARTSPDPAPDPGPDGDMIMEFDRARLSGTHAALAQFSARYAGHPLAAEAARPIWLAPPGAAP